MKILAVSDTHGDLAAWNKIMARFGQGLDYVVHAGDVLYHPFKLPIKSTYDAEGLAAAMNAAPCPVIIARGNCDADVFSLVLKWPLQDPIAFLQVNDFRLLTTHGDKIPRSQFADLGERFRADVVVFGHSHQPVLEKEGKTLILNPGSASLPRAPAHGRAIQTAALIVDRQVEIFDIETGEAVLSGSVG